MTRDSDRDADAVSPDHVPDAEVSSETTPPDPDDAGVSEFSGTGVPGAAPDSAESLPPGDAGEDDPQETMESGGGSRVLRSLRALVRGLEDRLPGNRTSAKR